MNTTQHPLVSQYLDDLSRMLHHLPPGDRAEVLAGVREHIEAGLAERRATTVGDVSAVLAELGPPEDVARAAYESGHGPGLPTNPYAVAPPLPAQPVRLPISDRRWVPVVVAILQAIAMLLAMIVALGTAAVMTSSSSDGVETVDYAVGSGLMVAMGGILTALPLWIAVVLLAGNSTLWTGRQKLAHILLLPVGVLLVGVLPDLGWIVAGERGLNVVAIASLLLVVLGGFWLVLRLTIEGRRRASAVGQVGLDSGAFDAS